jgi:hypothetical protein
MSLCYPMQSFGRYGLSLGLTYKLIHERFGVDLGERYHRDLDYRVRTTMEIDRAVFDRYGRIGLGYREPFPRITIEPFGHRFMPAMYGCECSYAADAEPWGRARGLTKEQIEALPPWTPERFEASEPVQIVLAQIAQLKTRCDNYRVPSHDFCPHYRTMSALQNLGSVINTALSVQGEQFLIDYMTEPDLVRRLYMSITQLMLLCLERFPQIDGWPLRDVFIGNCSVAMISPRQYAEFNEPADWRIMEFARSIGARLMIHQDSNANPHLENYAQFDYVQAFDLGQDTDFERLYHLCPRASVNCILFPSWIGSHSGDEIRAELVRLMRPLAKFPVCSFSLLDIDTKLDGDPLFAFCETFAQCAQESERSESSG